MVLYLKSHRRMPVRLSHLLPGQDVQAAVPWGWCRCGNEIYRGGSGMCEGCRKEKYYGI